VLAIGGLAAGGLIAAGGIIKLAASTASLVSDFNQLAPAGSRARGVITGVGKAATIAGLTLAATGATARLMAEQFGGAEAGVKDADAAIAALATNGSRGVGELNRLFTDAKGGWGSHELVAGVDNVSSAFDRLYDKSAGQKFGDAVGGIARGMFGIKTEVATVTAQFDNLDASLLGLDTARAASAFEQIREQANNAGVGVDQLVALFPQYAATLRETAANMGVVNLSNAELVDWMGGKVPPAVQVTAAAAQSAGKDVKGLGLDMADTAAKARDMANAALEASNSQLGMEAAIDGARDAVKANGKSLDETTDKGRANRRALNSLASATLGYADAMRQANKPTSEINAAIGRGRSSFVKMATAMGLSAPAARRLATELGLVKQKDDQIPKSKSTKVSAPGATGATSQVNTFRARVDGIAAARGTRITATASTGAAEAALNYTARPRRSTVIQTVSVQRAKADGGMEFFANGGMRGSFVGQQPHIRRAGGAGITWAEEGAGPWESWISGHPAKRRRSRLIAEQTVAMLGGEIAWAQKMADGGIRVPAATPWVPSHIPALSSSGGSGLSLAGLPISGTLVIPGVGEGYIRGIVQSETAKDRAHATHDRRRLTGRR